MSKAKAAKLETLEPVTDGGNETISFQQPYTVKVKVRGTTPMLFHRWNCESVQAKSEAKKGSKAKKTDDVESYVYRDADGYICIPSEYFRMSIINAAKFTQDPRSPRKSAMDLFKAAILPLNALCSLGTKNWDYLDQRRVTVQRNGITRQRPAFNIGWETEFTMQVILPEYINRELLQEVLQRAGQLVGVGDMRPTYGRFQITAFEVI